MEQQMREPKVDKPLAAPRKGPLELVLSLLTLAAVTIALMLTIVVLIPDENDYAKSTLLKHERLASLTGRKVVLVGGSNLSFGMESDIIERETACPTVNMGMNGYFGARYMLNEVKPDLRSGDIVVLAFEWDNYGKSVDGTGKDLLAIVKTNPSALAYLTPHQMGAAALETPYIAQVKILRVMRQSIQAIRSILIDTEPQEKSVINEVESFKSFDFQGDLNGHDGVVWDWEFDQGIDLTTTGLDLEIISLIKDFVRDMRERDVTVIVSYTPTMRQYYELQSGPINEAHRLLTSGPNAVEAPRPPDDFVFDSSYFFDTVYHLKTTSRVERSQMVADDIHTVLGTKPDCRINAP
jgi:hypothetical protein